MATIERPFKRVHYKIIQIKIDLTKVPVILYDSKGFTFGCFTGVAIFLTAISFCQTVLSL